MTTVYINHDNIWARLDTPIDVGVAAYLYEELKYRPDGYEHVWSFKSNKWDGYNRLYNTRDHSFRRGLLDRVVSLLEAEGHEVKLKGSGSIAGEVEHRYRHGLIQPFEHQQKVVPIIKQNDIGIIVSPTGTGKTVMVGMILAALKMRSMVLVTDVVLLDQMCQALQSYFDQPIGIIGDGEFDLQEITVSTIQSLLSIVRAKAVSSAEKRKKLMKHVERVGVVLSDEAHLYDSDGVAEVVPIFSKTERFYGMSATPYGWAEKAEKRQNLELEQHFGRVIYDCRKVNFIEVGLKVPILVDVVTRQPLFKEYRKHLKKTRYGSEPDWTKNYRDCLETEILKNPQYHETISQHAWKLASTGKSAFIHAAHSIEFGEQIQKLIPGAVLVNGKTPRLKRREIYEAMRKKELLTLVSDVGGTGLDIPSLDTMILASDVKDVRQLLGRVSRKPRNGTKEQGVVLDIHTETQFLSKHHRIRRGQYEHEGYTIIG